MGLEQFSLEGRVAIVTGATGGLGEALSYALADAGARVAVAARKMDKLEPIAQGIRASGHQAIAIEADVSQSADVDRLVQRVLDEWGGIDILVNLATRITMRGLMECEEKEWDDIVDANLKGTWLCSKRVAREMMKTGKGRIINFSSVAGQMGISGMGAYSASKGGIVQVTRTLAVELAKHQITVNCIVPGFFVSPWNEKEWNSNKWLREATARRIPLGRGATMDELTAPAVFLASDASAHITGHILNVDGGWAMYGNVT